MDPNALPKGKSCVERKKTWATTIKTLQVNTFKGKPRLRRTDLTQAMSDYSVFYRSCENKVDKRKEDAQKLSGVVKDSEENTLTL